MSVRSRRPNSASRRIRTLFLMLLTILLILLCVYVALPYVPLRRAGPTSVSAVTPTESATVEPSPTERQVAKPSLTYTPVLPVSTEAGGTTAPSPTRGTPVKTPTPRPPTPSATLTPRVGAASATPISSPEMATSDETAQPPASPTPLTTASAPTPSGTAIALAPSRTVVAPSPSRTPVAPSPSPTPAAALPSPTPAEAVSPIAPTVPPTAAPVAARVVRVGDGLLNSTFDQGFIGNGVAVGWDNFNNSSAEFSYHADTWPWVYPEPGRTQTMRILNAALPDRYMGIYQTVEVVPGQVYTLTITGLVRTNVGDVQQTRYGYRMQIGFDLSGGRNWKAVNDWIELPWDEQPRASEHYRIDSYTTNVVARSDRLTVFVRAWKKWADVGEGAYDVDSVSLIGPVYAPTSALPAPTVVGVSQAPSPGGDIGSADVPAAQALPPAGDIGSADIPAAQALPPGGDIGSADIPAAQALPLPATGQPQLALWDNARTLVTLTLLVALIGGAFWRAGQWRPM
jgi:hypothetical protein